MDKTVLKQKQEELLNLVAGFCAEKLNEEYLALADKLIKKLGRKKDVPFMRGRPEIWAAAIIHALGSVNWMFDKSNKQYTPAADINAYFGTSSSTTSQKAALIKDMLDMDHWNDEWHTRSTKDSNPFNQIVMVNGLPMPISVLPEELLEELRRVRGEGGDLEFRTK